MTIESGVRRIVVGVDGSAESVAALGWACREASLRAAEVLAVLALESACHQVASYAVPAPRQSGGSWGAARDVLRSSNGPDPYRAAGPVIRACLRAARCPVVIIGAVDAVPPDPADHVPGWWQRALEGSGAAR